MGFAGSHWAGREGAKARENRQIAKQAKRDASLIVWVRVSVNVYGDAVPNVALPASLVKEE
jgi:hypothetical protein